MPDVVILAQNVSVKLPSSGSIIEQPVEEAFDASPYVSFRFQPVLLAQNPVGAAAGIAVAILTSMTKDDNAGSWISVGSVDILGSAMMPEWEQLFVPSSASPPTPLLYRYIRWRITLKTGTTSATFSILGMADRV